ncbi:hypothetical protein D3C75_598020 [compost metagenome]
MFLSFNDICSCPPTAFVKGQEHIFIKPRAGRGFFDLRIHILVPSKGQEHVSIAENGQEHGTIADFIYF